MQYCSTCQKFQLFILVKRTVTRKSSTHGDQFYQVQVTIGVALLEADTVIHIINVMCNKNKQNNIQSKVQRPMAQKASNCQLLHMLLYDNNIMSRGRLTQSWEQTYFSINTLCNFSFPLLFIINISIGAGKVMLEVIFHNDSRSRSLRLPC